MNLEKAASQTSEKERLLLREYASGCERAAELGVYEAVNTSNIARSLTDRGTLYAIDPFYPGRLRICWSYHIAKREIRLANLEDRVRFIRRLSWEAAEVLPDDFDFVFFDGDHSAEGLRRDWEAWASKIRKNGHVALHDVIEVDGITPHASHFVFRDTILPDPRFRVMAKVDSLAILRRL